VVREFYKSLKPLSVNAPPDEVFQKALALAREQPRWQVTAVDPQARTFEAWWRRASSGSGMTSS